MTDRLMKYILIFALGVAVGLQLAVWIADATTVKLPMAFPNIEIKL